MTSGILSSEHFPSSGRRPFQFSLRTLLIAAAVVAAVCGVLSRLPVEVAVLIAIFGVPLAALAGLLASLRDELRTLLPGAAIGALIGAGLSEWLLGVHVPSSFFWPSVFAGECAALFGAGAGSLSSGHRRGIIAMIAAVVWYVTAFAAVVIYALSNISH